MVLTKGSVCDLEKVEFFKLFKLTRKIIPLLSIHPFGMLVLCSVPTWVGLDCFLLHGT